MKTTILGSIFLLTSCVTTSEEVTQNLSSWNGAHKSEVTEKFGLPIEKIDQDDGGQIYAYKIRRQVNPEKTKNAASGLYYQRTTGSRIKGKARYGITERECHFNIRFDKTGSASESKVVMGSSDDCGRIIEPKK